jgi:hypothetical protein
MEIFFEFQKNIFFRVCMQLKKHVEDTAAKIKTEVCL